jgi:hypothetical protein
LERGLSIGGLLFAIGLIMNLYILFVWLGQGFGGQPRLREAILAMTLTVVGLQLVFSSFFLSLLFIKRE